MAILIRVKPSSKCTTDILEYSYKPKAWRALAGMAASAVLSAYMVSLIFRGRGLVIQNVIHLTPKVTAYVYLVLAVFFALTIPAAFIVFISRLISKGCVRLSETEISFHETNRSQPSIVVRFADINEVSSSVDIQSIIKERYIKILHSRGKLLIAQSHLPSSAAYEHLYAMLVNSMSALQSNHTIKCAGVQSNAIKSELPKARPADIITRNIIGIGTTLYGKRDFWKDRSYITTVWLIFLYLPLIPLNSFRLRNSVADSSSSTTQAYDVLGKEPLSWRQIFYTYGYVASFFALNSLSLHSGTLFLIAIGGWVCTPIALRCWAKYNVEHS